MSVNWESIGSDNGLSPIQRQAIIWTNAWLLSIGPLGTNFSEIWIKIQNFTFKKMHLKTFSVKCRSFCLGLDVLSGQWGMSVMSPWLPLMKLLHRHPFISFKSLQLAWRWHQRHYSKLNDRLILTIFCQGWVQIRIRICIQIHKYLYLYLKNTKLAYLYLYLNDVFERIWKIFFKYSSNF